MIHKTLIATNQAINLSLIIFGDRSTDDLGLMEN